MKRNANGANRDRRKLCANGILYIILHILRENAIYIHKKFLGNSILHTKESALQNMMLMEEADRLADEMTERLPPQNGQSYGRAVCEGCR